MKWLRTLPAVFRANNRTILGLAGAAVTYLVLKLLGVPMDRASRDTAGGAFSVIALAVLAGGWIIYKGYQLIVWLRPSRESADPARATDSSHD